MMQRLGAFLLQKIEREDEALSNGTIPESTIFVFAGILGVIVIIGIVLGVIIQLNTLRSKAKIDSQAAVDKAVAEATKETKSEIAFVNLTTSVEKMNTTVDKLSKGVGDQISGIVKEQETLCRKVDLIDQSTRSAHKRLDEHRRVEHGTLMFRDNNHFSPEETTEHEDMKG